MHALSLSTRLVFNLSTEQNATCNNVIVMYAAQKGRYRESVRKDFEHRTLEILPSFPSVTLSRLPFIFMLLLELNLCM